MFNEVNY